MSHEYPHPTDRRNPLAVSSLPPNSFLSSICVYSVDADGQLRDSIGAPVEQLVRRAVDCGSARVAIDDDTMNSDSSAAIAIPVHRGGRVVSVAALLAKRLPDDRDDVIGVLEVWEPIGIYDELALKCGFYGRMERFRNVSSFVRFEKGNGLPGQVWQQRCSVIHNDLSNHPGFLRAAGASADLLVTAVGIPVASRAFHGTALLISSAVSPLARGFEVWHVRDDAFSLADRAYCGLGGGIELPRDTLLPTETGLPALASRAGGAVLCDDAETIFAGRNHELQKPESACALAIPFFDGDSLTSVTTFLF